MATKWLWAAPVAGALGIGAGHRRRPVARRRAPDEAKQDLKPAVTLPITRVVLFNSRRRVLLPQSGEVEGDARVDLTFPESGHQRPAQEHGPRRLQRRPHRRVSYDSREPIARTLASFAINLNGNPTFAGIVSQMRGERVEVAVSPTAANQPGKLTGAIVGVEKQKVPAGQRDGRRRGAEHVVRRGAARGQAVRRPATAVLQPGDRERVPPGAGRAGAVSHDAQKKAVQLHFAGEGKRKVQVGYVVEAPIWKTSYRLVLAEKEKPYLQGWAMVENPTDEDWAGVKMALISGPADLLQDGPVQPALRRPARRSSRNSSPRSGPSTYRGGFGTASDGVAPSSGPDGRRSSTSSRRRSAGAAAGGRPPARPRRRRGAGAAPPAAKPSRLACGRRSRPNDAERASTRSDVGRGTRPRGSAPAAVGNAATAGALGDFFQYIDRPPGLARPSEVGAAADRRQGRRGHEGLHLQPGRPGQAPAARAEVQEHLAACT